MSSLCWEMSDRLCSVKLRPFKFQGQIFQTSENLSHLQINFDIKNAHLQKPKYFIVTIIIILTRYQFPWANYKETKCFTGKLKEISN